MFFHHVTAIVLIVVSYLSNFVRIGAIVLVLHDISDVFLESAKLAKYSKCGKAGDFLFALFALSFFVFRLVIFPLHVIKSAMFDASHLSKETNMRILFVAFLLVLFGLHLFWFSLIMKMVIQVYRGEMNKDIRSDSELEETIEKLDQFLFFFFFFQFYRFYFFSLKYTLFLFVFPPTFTLLCVA